MKIICDGDSWMFGSEIVDPIISSRYGKDIHPGEYDWIPENDEYRIPKIFPTILSNLMDSELVNLSCPANDNGTILNRTISYITENYLSKNKSVDDLFVIIGWSSPERNSFWYKDEKVSDKFVLWPNVKNLLVPNMEEFWEIYVTYLWNKEEFLPRFVNNVLSLQNFCDANKIKWLCFNSFYQTPENDISRWDDLNVRKELSQINLNGNEYYDKKNNNRKYFKYNYLSMWDTIDNVRFYKKDQSNNSFKSFMVENNPDKPYNGWHPSPESHKIWAEEIFRYINDNNLTNEKSGNLRRFL